METNQALLNDYIMGDLRLKNRVVMAPMTRCRADNPGNVATDLMAEYYAQRATAGLIISEGSQISKRAVGYVNTPGIHADEQVEGWKKVTAAVHAKGVKYLFSSGMWGACPIRTFTMGSYLSRHLQ